RAGEVALVPGPRPGRDLRRREVVPAPLEQLCPLDPAGGGGPGRGPPRGRRERPGEGGGAGGTAGSGSRTVPAGPRGASMHSRAAGNCVTYDPGARLPRAPSPDWLNGYDSWATVWNRAWRCVRLVGGTAFLFNCKRDILPPPAGHDHNSASRYPYYALNPRLG